MSFNLNYDINVKKLLLVAGLLLETRFVWKPEEHNNRDYGGE